MIVWKGWGFLVAVIVFFTSLIAELISESFTNNENYYQEHGFPLSLALLVAGIISGLLGKWLNTRKAKVFIEKDTGKEIVIKNSHSLFFIPMEYWGIILAVSSVLVYILK